MAIRKNFLCLICIWLIGCTSNEVSLDHPTAYTAESSVDVVGEVGTYSRTVSVNGSPVPTDGRAFRFHVPLKPGKNRIVVNFLERGTSVEERFLEIEQVTKADYAVRRLSERRSSIREKMESCEDSSSDSCIENDVAGYAFQVLNLDPLECAVADDARCAGKGSASMVSCKGIPSMRFKWSRFRGTVTVSSFPSLMLNYKCNPDLTFEAKYKPYNKQKALFICDESSISKRCD